MIIILTGCQDLGISSPLSPSLTTSPLPPTPSKTDDLDPLPVRPGGHLAYIGADGNVYVTTAERTTTIAMTDDATAPHEGAGLSYQRISWSPDGRLAFAAVTRLQGDKARSKLYVAETLDSPAQVVGQSDEHFVIYIYWSPVPCPGRPACRQLAYLIEERDDIGLHIVEMDDDRLDNQIVGLGWPFYFSWSPDGQAILWHTGGARRDNPQARMALYDINRANVQTLPQTPGSFLAPAWSPQGRQWLSIVAEETPGQLQILGDRQPITLANALKGDVAFVWSPGGDRVAYAMRKNSNDPFYGPIHIFDLKTGEAERLTDVGLRILGFFWTPQGERIGYLTWLPLPDVEWMQWRVYDLATNEDRGYKAFHPSLQMRFVVSSFNQYAQSHRFWSPDGRYLVYANRDGNHEERIWLIDTWDNDGTEAILVGGGTMGFWSWN